MRLALVSRRATCGNAGVRSSYAEISRFVRTRHHGITLYTAKSYTGQPRRSFASSRASRSPIEPDEKLRKTLEEFKATIRPSFSKSVNQIGPQLSKHELGSEVTLCGYLGTRRDVSKKMSFTLLKNPQQTWCVQVVSTLNAGADAHNSIRSLKEWSPVLIKGKVKERKPAKESPVSGMLHVNDREIELQSIEPLNEIPSDLIIKEDTVFPPELRHLQLRTDRDLLNNLIQRSTTVRHARAKLAERNWTEVETPILFKSTPEGAREFLVPTRTKGLAYALPQSPQQYKQILMASGITKYFQFARCFRDEDLRADRQPEFTQLDMEMAWAGEEDVMTEIEELLKYLWSQILDQKIPDTFERMTYQEAMASYGSDKPDLRIEAKIFDVTKQLPQDLISKITDLKDPAIDAFSISISDDPRVTKKFVSEFLDSAEGKPFLDNPDGQPGIFVVDGTQPLQGLGALGHEFAMTPPEGIDIEHGELLVLQARKNEAFSGGSTSLGNLRLALHKAAVAQDLIEQPEGFKFVWIKDFPLFTPSNDTDPGQGGTAGFSATHHPFTAPRTPEDVELLLTAPEKAVAAHYDIVVNGVELGGGSRRIHNAELQEFIFKDILKMRAERVEDFRHLLDVLRSGCPPHSGIALGWDRLMAVMLGKQSVRDVIAFPKSGRGEDLLVKSPNSMTAEQLDTYHLRLKE